MRVAEIPRPEFEGNPPGIILRGIDFRNLLWKGLYSKGSTRSCATNRSSTRAKRLWARAVQARR